MKLTGDLKNQVEKAESKDEKKSLIENAGMELTDDELENVAGGGGCWSGQWIAYCNGFERLEVPPCGYQLMGTEDYVRNREGNLCPSCSFGRLAIKPRR